MPSTTRPAICWAAASALAVYALLLLLARPASPFEWDEVLFLHGLRDYDVLWHHPHPPGYPVFMGLGKALHLVLPDPLLALQLVAIAGAVAALALTARLARRSGAPAGVGWAAAALTAAVPAFTFYANVGLSDVVGAAAGLAALLALLGAGERRWGLALAAAAAALAMGVRPQLALLLLPAAAVVVAGAVRRRRWRDLAAAFASGVAVSIACWLPAVLATGWDSFFLALERQSRYVATVDAVNRLPAAPAGEVLQAWLLQPFGSSALAGGFWLLVVAGAATLWRRGCRRTVAVAASAAGCYLVAALFTLNYPVATRYVLPALPCLAILAAGVVAGRSRGMRRLGTAALGLWLLAGPAWAWHVYRLRRQPAPAWEALTWVREHFDPASTTVVYSRGLEPHVHYLLRNAGFKTQPGKAGERYGRELRPDGEVVLVAARPAVGGEVVLHRLWRSQRLRRMTRNRYHEATVMRPAAGGELVLDGPWRAHGSAWQVAGEAAVRLRDGAQPRVVRVQAASDLRLRSAGGTRSLAAGSVRELVLLAVPGGGMRVSASGGLLAPLELGDLALGGAVCDAQVLPQAAHVDGLGGSAWRTGVTLHNPQPFTLSLLVRPLPAAGGGRPRSSLRLTLAPGAVATYDDVLSTPALKAAGPKVALVLEADRRDPRCAFGGCAFLALSRTVNLRAPDGDPVGESLPGVPLARGLAPGATALLRPFVHDARVRGSIGLAVAGGAARVRLTEVDAAGRVLASWVEEMPGDSFRQVTPRRAVREGAVRVAVEAGHASARVFPFASMVDSAGRPTHLLPEELLADGTGERFEPVELGAVTWQEG